MYNILTINHTSTQVRSLDFILGEGGLKLFKYIINYYIEKKLNC